MITSCRRHPGTFEAASTVNSVLGTIQHRVLLALAVNSEQLFAPHMPQFWTLHSGRAFLPSATAAAVGCDKAERDFLGGESRKKSYCEHAESGCALLSKQSAENETLEAFEEFHTTRPTTDTARERCLDLLHYENVFCLPRSKALVTEPEADEDRWTKEEKTQSRSRS